MEIKIDCYYDTLGKFISYESMNEIHCFKGYPTSQNESLYAIIERHLDIPRERVKSLKYDFSTGITHSRFTAIVEM